MAEQFVVEVPAREGWSDHGRFREPDFGGLNDGTTSAPVVLLEVGATGFEPATARPPADTACLSIRPLASPTSPFMHDLDA